MQKNKKHIVIVSTWYPPLQSVAVNRMLAFAKYLDKTNFDVSVVTLQPDKKSNYVDIENIKVYRLKNNTFLKLPHFNSKDSKVKHKLKVLWKLFVLSVKKDEYSNWTKNALNQLQQIHQHQPIDLIISSFSPSAPHKSVYSFLKSNTKIKWIADMRDEMSNNDMLSANEKNKLIQLEKQINQRANVITTVSYPIVNYFKETFAKVNKIAEIRNGFDHQIKINKNQFNTYFTITYSGSFYGKRKPNTFFEALLKCKTILPKNWVIQFVGTANNFNIPSEFKNNIKFIGRVSQQESINIMDNSDVNLLVHPTEKRKGIFTGKLFDYASVKKPILAIIDPNDVAADLIKELNIGFIADFDDIEAIKQNIIKLVDLWKNKQTLDINTIAVEKLHRKYQVKKLEQLINEQLNEGV